MVGVRGFEPPTTCTPCSYRPDFGVTRKSASQLAFSLFSRFWSGTYGTPAGDVRCH